jgi:hypothetical protein
MNEHGTRGAGQFSIFVARTNGEYLIQGIDCACIVQVDCSDLFADFLTHPTFLDLLVGMMHQRMRAFAALGLFGCVTLTLMPLGCASSLDNAPFHQVASGNDPPMPETTSARLQECVETYRDQLPADYARVHYRVQVDKRGRIVDIETNDIPEDAPDFAACTRVVLRDMKVSDGMFTYRHSPSTGSTGGQTPAARGLMGTTTVLGAEIALEELLVGAAGTTVVFAVVLVVVASGVKDVVEAIDEEQENRRRCDEKLTECLDTYRSSRPGPLWKHSRCIGCRDVCMRLGGEWPSRIELGGRFVSCK